MSQETIQIIQPESILQQIESLPNLDKDTAAQAKLLFKKFVDNDPE